MNSLVSVIIPVFNVKTYLREALDSVINQTYKNIEILIIDDGSTDGSEYICDEYSSDTRVTVIHQENGGLSKARNTGLDQIKGEYVCFIDPDDAYKLTFIEKMLDELQKSHVEMVACKYTVQKTKGKLGSKGRKNKPLLPLLVPGKYNKDDVFRSMVRGELGISAWNKLYIKELWSNIRFPVGRNHEDIDTMYYVVDSCQTISMVDEVLYFKRDRIGSITHDYSEKNTRDLMLAYTNLDKFILSHHPELFDDVLLDRYKQKNMNVYIGLYAKCPKGSALHNELREQIIEKGRNLRKRDIRTKVAYMVICHMPCFFRGAYMIYLPFRLLLWKVTGR